MKTYALLTGRGNNTLKDKNVLDILGHPTLYYPAKSAQKANTVSMMFCSSDDDKILNEAAKLDHVPIKRPAELALPTSQHVDCIFHGLDVMKREYSCPDILVVTLANNVTIKPEWIDECVHMMEADMNISAVVPVYKDNDHHPLRAKKAVDGRLYMYEDIKDGTISTNRQDLPTCYFLAHNFWVLNVKKMIETNGKGQLPWGFMGDNIAYYEIEESIDIHNPIDIIIASDWIARNWSE